MPGHRRQTRRPTIATRKDGFRTPRAPSRAAWGRHGASLSVLFESRAGMIDGEKRMARRRVFHA